MKEKEVIIFIHGFKTKDVNDFDNFVKQNKDIYKDKEFVIFDFYESNNKKTINSKSFETKINDVFKKYSDREVKVIAYSFGSVIAIKKAIDFPNIKNIYLNVPAFHIYYLKWISSIKHHQKKNKKLKKKIGKERYKSLSKKIGANENFSIIAREISKYIIKNRKYIKKINNRNIMISYSGIDEISNNDKTIPFLKKNLKKGNNNVVLNKIDETHFKIIENETNCKYIDNFINDYKW